MERITGTVSSFDQARGLGVVTTESGTRWPFHCVSISDGSRTVEVGSRVTFEIAFRVLRLEATEIVKS